MQNIEHVWFTFVFFTSSIGSLLFVHWHGSDICWHHILAIEYTQLCNWFFGSSAFWSSTGWQRKIPIILEKKQVLVNNIWAIFLKNALDTFKHWQKCIKNKSKTALLDTRWKTDVFSEILYLYNRDPSCTIFEVVFKKMLIYKFMERIWFLKSDDCSQFLEPLTEYLREET